MRREESGNASGPVRDLHRAHGAACPRSGPKRAARGRSTITSSRSAGRPHGARSRVTRATARKCDPGPGLRLHAPRELWPQYRRRARAKFLPHRAAPRPQREADRRDGRTSWGSAGLAWHQWRKHRRVQRVVQRRITTPCPGWPMTASSGPTCCAGSTGRCACPRAVIEECVSQRPTPIWSLTC